MTHDLDIMPAEAKDARYCSHKGCRMRSLPGLTTPTCSLHATPAERTLAAAIAAPRQVLHPDDHRPLAQAIDYVAGPVATECQVTAYPEAWARRVAVACCLALRDAGRALTITDTRNAMAASGVRTQRPAVAAALDALVCVGLVEQVRVDQRSSLHAWAGHALPEPEPERTVTAVAPPMLLAPEPVVSVQALADAKAAQRQADQQQAMAAALAAADVVPEALRTTTVLAVLDALGWALAERGAR